MRDILIEFSDGEQLALRKEVENGYYMDKRFRDEDTAKDVFISYEQLAHLLLEESVQDNIVCVCTVEKGEWHI